MGSEEGGQGMDARTLLELLPCGVQQCLNDDGMTLLEVGQGFIQLFGYSRETLTRQFRDSFLSMVHPVDRPSIRAELSQSLITGGQSTLSCRVACEDGGYKWVLGGFRLLEQRKDARILCILQDLTGLQELRGSLEHLETILNQTPDILFEWDIQRDTLSFSPNWMKKFGYLPHYEGLQGASVFRDIHSEDAAALGAFMAEIRDGGGRPSTEVRIRDAGGRYLWCRIHTTVQHDTSGHPVKAVGVIADIDAEKRTIDNLKRRAELDALTGLYNRAETEQQIRRHLSDRPETLCALLMVDVDNFKQINDGQGHLLGDAVLSELAAGMKRLTRQSDVVGRIGGDEFAIFLKALPSTDSAGKKAGELVEMFRGLFRGEKRPVEITCSVGVALYPRDGGDFHALYHSADLALYQAKSRGKNQYALFDPERGPVMGPAACSALGAAIDSDRKIVGAPGDLANYVFQILYDARDIDRAVELILEIVGKRFDVSRAYIFENSEDGRFTSNTYEWCGEGVAPQKEFLQDYPYENVAGYRDLFRDSAIFYCRDVRSLTPEQAAFFAGQEIRSTLQCAIYYGEEFRGFIGFDECTGTRMWTKEEIGALSMISQMLTLFLQKKRVSDHDRQLAVRLNTILDTQDAFIYAIDQTTCELLYVNHKTVNLDPTTELGAPCYRAFFDRDLPCERCPLSGESEIYNSKYQLWTKVRVAPMRWGSRDAYLLSCFDITEYKRMQGPGCHNEI